MARDSFLKKSPEEKQADAAKGLAEYRAKEAAANANMARLRAERLAREADAANAPPKEAVEPTVSKPKKRSVRR